MSVIRQFLSQGKGHLALFRDLCRIHELDKATIQLLTQITQELGIEKKAMVFADSRILEQAVTLPSFVDSMEKLNELYNKWFGDSI